jgi:hypothetical protein
MYMVYIYIYVDVYVYIFIYTYVYDISSEFGPMDRYYWLNLNRLMAISLTRNLWSFIDTIDQKEKSFTNGWIVLVLIHWSITDNAQLWVLVACMSIVTHEQQGLWKVAWGRIHPAYSSNTPRTGPIRADQWRKLNTDSAPPVQTEVVPTYLHVRYRGVKVGDLRQ